MIHIHYLSARSSPEFLPTAAFNDQPSVIDSQCTPLTCLTEDQMALKDRLLFYMRETPPLLDEKVHLPALKSIPLSILTNHTQVVSYVLKCIVFKM